MCADARPHLPPCLDRLFAQLVTVRDPEDATFKIIVTHRLDDCLHGDPRLARTRRQTDQSTSLRAIQTPVAEHIPHPGDYSLLVVVEFWEGVRPFDFKIGLAVLLPISRPLG